MSPTGRAGRRRRLPRIPYLALSHHYEDRLNRTIQLRFLGWEQPLCTRCTSQWISCGAFAVVLHFYNFDPGTTFWAAALFALPFPALVDWVTQGWGLRESTTLIRVATGSALGLGYALELQAVIQVDITRALLGAAVYGSYMLVLLVLLKIRPISSGVFD